MQQPPPALYSPLSNHLMWLTTIFISVAQLLFVGIELYMLNKGFSIWDEGYYLLSYKMAQAGFYQHFTNTPFVVATLFEWFHPGIVAYRLIHLMANLFAAIFFTYVLILYLGALRISCNRKEQGLLYLLATYAALYSYQLAVPTLSYNHLNGFFILIAQAALMTAMLRQSLDKTTFVYLLLASCATAILVLIKPPSFVALAFLNIVLVILFFRSKLAAKYVFIYILGVFAALLVSLVLFLTPAQWLSYLSFMQEHKTHTPYAVLKSFLTTGFEALSAGGGVILLSIAVFSLSVNRVRFQHRNSRTYSIYKIVLYAFLLAWYLSFLKFVVPLGFVGSISINVWVWLNLSTGILLSLVVVSMTTVVLFWRAEHQLNLIVGLLFATPIIASIGTVNGFAQVQLYVFSWCMLIGVSYLICLRFASNKIKVLLSVFVVTAFLSMTGYFIKQMQPGNFAGYSSISENNNQILFGPLKGIWVDQDTSQLLVEINKIIAAYPHAPTVAFFDAPGLQYALGRDSAISDPWLSNLDQPRTKDDAYNCKMITSITLKESTQSIFIVTHQKEMSEQLKTCLGALGYPDKLKFLGLIKTNVGGLTEPVEIYLHP